MMEQEKRRMELEVSRMLLHQKKAERQLSELQFKFCEERRKRKKERKGRKVKFLLFVLMVTYTYMCHSNSQIR